MIQIFSNFSYFSTNLDVVYLCLTLFTFVQLTHLCTNFVLVRWPDILVYQCSAFQKILLTWLAFTPLILLGMSTAVVPPAATCPASCPSPWTTLSQPISRPHTKLQPIKVVQSFLRVFRDQPWCLCQLWLQSGISKALLDSLEDARETLMRLIPKSAAGNLKFAHSFPVCP